MNKWVIVAAILTGLGIAITLIGLASIDFNLSMLNGAQTVTNTYMITEEFQSISIDTHISNVSFFLSNDESCEVFCQETEQSPHTVRVEDGVLTVRQEDHRKWYDYIGFNWAEVKVVVLLPRAEFDRLQIATDTGKIDIGSPFSFNNVDVAANTGFVKVTCAVQDTLNIATTTGAISIEGVTVRTLNAACTTGKITISNVSVAEDLDAATTTGGLLLESCTAGRLQAECTTGRITLNNTVVSGKLQAQTSTGDITLNSCDGESLFLESDTGDITGTLLSKKIIYAQSDTGKISVPHSTTGGRCEITTDTGNIRIKIA